MFAKVVFQATAGLYTQFLNFLAENNIQLSEINHTSFGFTAVCYGEDYFFIARNSKKFQTKIRIVEKKGAYFHFRKIKRRKGVIVASVMFLILVYIFSNIIWVVNIHTADNRLKNIIAAQLFSYNIYPGAIYTEEKLERVADKIMLENDSLGYITLNFYKGTLDCNIYQRTNREEYINNLGADNIVAMKSGVITDIRVYDGFSQVTLGQSVFAGETLVSNIYTDKYGNIYTGWTRAYIEAACEEIYTVFIPFSKKANLLTGTQSSDISIYFLDNEFEVKKDDNMGNENSLKTEKLEYYSFMGFRFPLTVKMVTYYHTEEKTIEKDTSIALSYGKLQLEHMIKNDEKLKKEISRTYDYNLQQDGIIVRCKVSGIYEIT